MHNHDESGARFLRQRAEQLLQRADATGRGADANQDSFWMAWFRLLFPFGLACFIHSAVTFFGRLLALLARHRPHLAHL
jgi:hypothetical protein